MKLSVTERLMLLDILPTEGNIVTLKVVQQARERLGFTDEEISRYKFAESPGADGRMFVRWDQKPDQDVEIPLGETITAMIAERLRKLNADSKLTANHVSLYEKFV